MSMSHRYDNNMCAYIHNVSLLVSEMKIPNPRTCAVLLQAGDGRVVLILRGRVGDGVQQGVILLTVPLPAHFPLDIVGKVLHTPPETS